MAISRTAITDDSGGGTDGTGLDNAWKQELYDQIDAAFTFAETHPTTTGTITAEPIPTGGGILATYHNNATLKTIQGMVAGVHGQIWMHYSKGAGQVDFQHLHASGTALGKCKLFATTGVTSMAAGSGTMAFQYDATAGVTQWKLVFHEQGAWITPTFAAGNYTATAGTWTLAAGDVVFNAYRLSGRTLQWHGRLATTSVSNAGVVLQAAIPGGFTAAGSSLLPNRVNDNAAGYVAAYMLVNAGAAVVQFVTTYGGAGFAVAVNTTEVDLAVDIEVT